MSLRDLLDGLPIAILQAPMVGASGPEMALAVSKAGGAGSLAAGAMAPADIEATVAQIKAATERPFGVNLLMAPKATPTQDEVDAALERLGPWYAALGASPPALPNEFAPDFDAQLAAVVAARPAFASFTFSILTPEQVQALQSAGIYVIGTATTVAEARAWAAVGADGICAQGFEAGGHRGHFLAEVEASLVGTLALTRLIVKAIDLPVVAAGGIMDGAGVAAALALGASAAQMGTAFLLADQSVASAPWRRAVERVCDDGTALTRAFTGRYARGIENRFMREMRPVEREVPTYPVQNRLTQPLRAAAAKAGEPEILSLWAGQAVRLARPGEAGAMVEAWWREAREAAQAAAARTGRPPG